MQPVRLSFVFYDIKSKKEFRIATVAMFTCDLYAGVVPQMRELSRRCRHRRTTSNGYARLRSIL